MLVLVLVWLLPCLRTAEQFYNVQKPNFQLDLGENEKFKFSHRDRLLEWTKVTSNATKIQLGYFAICLCARNEHAYIREWVQYHIWKGTSKIYLYDNGSQPPMIEILQDFIMDGYLDYFYFTHSYEADDFEMYRMSQQQDLHYGKTYAHQQWAYNICFWTFGHRHAFVGVFDTDEFLITPGNPEQKIPDFLKDYEQFGGLNVYRNFFGTSGLQKKPNGTVLESYTKCAGDPYAYPRGNLPKQIVNMRYFGGACFIHYCLTQIPTVNTQKVAHTDENVDSKKYVRTFDGLVLNHYYTKSFEELKNKYIRRISRKAMESGQNFSLNGVVEKQLKNSEEADKFTSATCDEGIELSRLCCENLDRMDNM